MPTNLDNSAVATGLEKVGFPSNPSPSPPAKKKPHIQDHIPGIFPPDSMMGIGMRMKLWNLFFFFHSVIPHCTDFPPGLSSDPRPTLTTPPSQEDSSERSGGSGAGGKAGQSLHLSQWSSWHFTCKQVNVYKPKVLSALCHTPSPACPLPATLPCHCPWLFSLASSPSQLLPPLSQSSSPRPASGSMLSKVWPSSPPHTHLRPN